jgi:hypothetical protein
MVKIQLFYLIGMIKTAGNIRSYCMPLKVLKIGICAFYGHSARRQNCINQSGTQHSAAR